MSEMIVILKLLDLAALGFQAWQRYDERKRQGTAAMVDIEDLRRRIIAGTVTADEASVEVDRISSRLIDARKAAMARLPGYSVSEVGD
jgi:hypothetical protein